MTRLLILGATLTLLAACQTPPASEWGALNSLLPTGRPVSLVVHEVGTLAELDREAGRAFLRQVLPMMEDQQALIEAAIEEPPARPITPPANAPEPFAAMLEAAQHGHSVRQNPEGGCTVWVQKGGAYKRNLGRAVDACLNL